MHSRIANCLEGPSFKQLRRALDLEIRDTVKRHLMNRASDAVGHWERSIHVAADKGDHKPSKDWLLLRWLARSIISRKTTWSKGFST